MRAFVSFLVFLLGSAASAETASVAVARNFEPALRALAEQFQDETGHRLKISSGSTGKLYAQIVNGAPFDVFLAADQARPAALESTALAVQNSRFTYALGRLVLWHPDGDRLSADTLRAEGLNTLSMANPDLAPYGAASQKLLSDLIENKAFSARIVLGEDVGQAFAFVRTGNAEMGFVAKSQVLSLPDDRRGAFWEPDPALYPPIYQDAILLRGGAENEAATAFLAFLGEPGTQERLRELGYELP